MYSTHDGTNITAINARGSQEVEHARSALIWGADHRLYYLYNEQLTPRSAQDVADILQADQAIINAVTARIAAIKEAKEDSAIKGITVDQAETYIENQLDVESLPPLLTAFDAASDLASVKTATRAILISIYQQLVANKNLHITEIPYILE